MHEIRKSFPASRQFDTTVLHNALKHQYGDMFDSLDTERDGVKMKLTLRFKQPIAKVEANTLAQMLDGHQPDLTAQNAPVLDLAQRVERLETQMQALLVERG